MTRSESFVCNPNQFLPPFRKPKAPPSTFIASAGPLGDFQSGCRELEYVISTSASSGNEYNALPFFSFAVTVTVPSARSTMASRSRRLSPSLTTACASNRKGVDTAARARTVGALGSVTVGAVVAGFVSAFGGAEAGGSTSGGGAISSGGGVGEVVVAGATGADEAAAVPSADGAAATGALVSAV